MKDKTTKASLPDVDDFEILSIDPNLLDKEWLNQPRFFFQYAKMLADARQKWEESKANLKVIAAEADQKVRMKAVANEERITEAAVNSAVLRRNDYKEAEQAVFTAKHNVDVLDAAVEALRHRKDALENLVRLRLAQYFGDPKVEATARRMLDDMQMRRTVKDRRNSK